MTISGDLRTNRLTSPSPQRGAPCGLVDILDFPVGPPDGSGYSAPWPFGYYSDRYNGIHTGEDWIYRGGGSSQGKPVYAIGHGTVTYAQPLGWGIDQGVVIVRHVFADGHTVLSFYGHLDPSSVVLRAGDCVKRGDQVGIVGNPRGRPHLHFEIRHQLPDAPGPGYWSVDPRRAGWEIPTDYIWDERMSTAPGVDWIRTFTSTDSIGVGLLGDNSLIAYDNAKLMALDADSGQLKWSRSITATVYRAIVNPHDDTIYLSTITGTVQSVSLTGTLRWQIDFGETVRPQLMPLPGGGVIVYADRRLISLSSTAIPWWQIDMSTAPFDWRLLADRLIFTTGGDQAATMTIDRSGQLIRLAGIGGRLAIAHDQVFIYNPTGIYRLNPITHAADRLRPLDAASYTDGQIVAAPDGTLLVAHRGRYDWRLIALNPDGTFRWDRSIADLDRTLPRLIAIGQQAYAVTHAGEVLLIDMTSGDARRIFDGGGRLSLPGEAWAFETRSGRMVFDFRLGTLVGFDPAAVR
jgi:murein DD-endopeptidase MepM/ murein hydrolase activator NlpD